MLPPSALRYVGLGDGGVRDRLAALDGLRPDFVSLLIGVNDVVQGVPGERYRANVATIINTLTGRLPADRILTVSTPDYTVTLAGADYGDPARQSAAIRAFNAILAAEAGARGIPHAEQPTTARAWRTTASPPAVRSTRCGSSASFPW